MKLPLENKNKDRDFYLFPIGVDRKYRNKLIEHLLKKNFFVTVNFRSIAELNYYKKKYKKFNCPISEKWEEKQSVCLSTQKLLKKGNKNCML